MYIGCCNNVQYLNMLQENSNEVYQLLLFFFNGSPILSQPNNTDGISYGRKTVLDHTHQVDDSLLAIVDNLLVKMELQSGFLHGEK